MSEFESAVVYTTFTDESLPKNLRRLAKHIEGLDDFDDDNFVIENEFSDDKWYTSFISHYWNEKRMVSMIKRNGEEV